VSRALGLPGPLVAYQLLRSAGQSAVSALVLSGILPALGLVINLVRRRRLDAVGTLTAVFGLACLGSLWGRRPLIYRFALEFTGEDSPRGREFSSLWQYPAFRHAFNLFTVVWGVTYLAEAAARVALVELTSTSTALAVSKFMPYVVAGALVLWMTGYARRAKCRRAVQQASPARTPSRPHRPDRISPARSY
jgi:hypothetical protein